MTESDVEDGAAEQKVKAERRRKLIIAWTNVVVMTCFLLYLTWKWYADPGATWQHWAWILVQAWVFIWVINRIISKTFAE
ncbi:MAG TPA: hypothetical protein VGM16_05625 [Gammaproteobacteria bacterium]